MTSSLDATRQQTLISLALKKDPILLHSKSTIEGLSSRNVTFNELPSITAKDFPPSSPTIIPTSARSISTAASILKKRSATVTPQSSKILRSPLTISPLIPLVGSVILLLVIGTVGIFLPPYLLSLQTHQDISCIPGCWNGGNCSAKNICTCLSGFQGDRCQTPICNQSCIYGLCTTPYQCSCQTGWNGTYCDQPVCSTPCVNGNCTQPSYCSCNVGYTGSLCQTPICSPSCVNGFCSSPNNCTCYTGWNGTICDQPICSPSCVHGNCTYPNVCNCSTGWTGSLCNIPICSPICQHNSNCTAPNTCVCSAGYNGSYCQNPICPSGCLNGGTCIAPSNCTCQSNYTGLICDQPVCRNSCLNNGSCIAPDTCNCTTGWTGNTCQTPICTSPCLNGGTCIAPNNCSCDTNNWIGLQCQTPVCNIACLHNGTCGPTPQICTCTSQWTDSLCGTPVCSNPCQNQGTCIAPNNCTCPISYNGSVCQYPICRQACNNGGICIAPDECNCTTSWSGDLCNLPRCNPICQNGGTCVSPNTCLCINSSWIGANCQTPVCTSSCQNSGTCIGPNICQCTNGYTGNLCQQPICVRTSYHDQSTYQIPNATCQHGGVCVAPNNCSCTSSWNGSYCEYPICNPACLNNGTCSTPNNCTCNTNLWNGTICQIPVCNPSCLNNGNCSAPNNCTCDTNLWNGTICENPICNPACLNNGTCSTPNNCTCNTTLWNGTICQTPVCNPACVNGNCSSPGVCTCFYGWTGTYCQTVTFALWTFDNTLNDLSGLFTGTGYNSPTYTSGINGYGSALVLNGTNSQCVIVTPYLSMSYMSFSWEFWIYPTITPTGDSMFIGQCSQGSTRDGCLIFMTRSDAMWFAFWGDDVTGHTLIPANQWSHMAFVYDYSLNIKYIYLNGVFEATQNSIGPLEVTSTIMTFGCLTTTGGSPYYNYFTGYIDQMLFSSRIKNTSEILDDATLVIYYRFLSATPSIDSGPNYINGTLGGGATSITSGIVNQAINFNVSGSYFLVTGLVLLGTSNWPFSFSIWFKTTLLDSGGTIAHLSSSSAGTGWCIRFMGLTVNGNIEIQIHNSATNVVYTGPIMPIGVWNHVVYTFSSANGIRLYIGGTLYGSSATTYSASGVPDTIILGNPLSGTACGSSLPNKQFYGSVDEFRLYSREITASEVSQLYSNP